jgi:hypothetical protein
MLPKGMLVVLTLIVDTTAFRLMAKLLDTPAELAVTVTFCADAVNAALVAPAATITAAGTTTAVLLLDSLTLNPELGAGPDS